jgi:hypothetical protein
MNAAGRRMTGAVLLAFLALCVTGCAAPPSEPFARFTAAATSIQESADKLAAGLVTPADDRLVAMVHANPSDVNNLRIEPALPAATVPPTGQGGPGKPRPGDELLDFRFSDQANYEMKMAAYREALLSFNRGLAGYAASLQALAGPGTVDDKAIDQNAKNLNASLRNARDTLKLDKKDFSDESIALFTTVAAEGFRAYQHRVQRERLLAVLRQGDQKMPAVARLGEQATTILAECVWREYDTRSGELARTVLASNANDATDRAVRSLLDLNRTTATQITALAALRSAYKKLPDAHHQLIDAVENSSSLEALQSICDEAIRITNLMDSLKKSSK